jgi:hypothetical protein
MESGKHENSKTREFRLLDSSSCFPDSLVLSWLEKTGRPLLRIRYGLVSWFPKF